MGFLFPAVLGGLAALAIPIAIHLLNKFRVRKIDWAAMRFLEESLRKNERRVKLEDLLLLLLRCLFIALLVLAFARPVWRELMAGGADSTGAATTVVLLDNSASMQQGDSVGTMFDTARQDIHQWLDNRESNSLAALHLVSNRTQAVIARPEADRNLFRKLLDAARPGDRGTNLAQGVRLAYQTLQSTGGGRKEIRVYSDDQATGWRGADEVRQLARQFPDITLTVVPVAGGVQENLGITSLTAEGGVPSAGQPGRIRVEVGNYGTQPAENVVVSLAVDGAPAGESLMPPIAPGTKQAVEIVVNFPTPGPHAVTASIPPDAFAPDNARSMAVDVVRRMEVLIVEGSPGGELPVDRDGFFLANALVPLSPDRADQYYLACTFLPQADLSAALLGEARAVFLANPGPVTPQAARMLRDYVEGGGNLVIFPGPMTDPGQWRQNQEWAGLLPATLGPETTAEPDQLPSWQTQDFEHPVTALWNDSAAGSLGGVKLARYFPLEAKEAGEGTGRPPVLARLTDGSPAAVEWSVGDGHVVLFNSTATPAWNNLPLHRGFVALMQRLMGFLTRSDQARLVLSPGQAFVQPVPADWRDRQFSIQPPGLEASPRVGGQVTFDEGKAYLRYANTDKTGVYRVFVEGELAAVFAVQLDPRESDLRPYPAEALARLAQPDAGDEDVAPSMQLVVRQEYWEWLIWAVLAVAILESFFAYRFSQAR